MGLRFWHIAANGSFVSRAGLLLFLAIVLPTSGQGADLPPSASPLPSNVETTPTTDAGSSPASDSEINVYKPNVSCPVWTDGCRSCRRDDAGNVICSNIGIACQPGPITCNQN